MKKTIEAMQSMRFKYYFSRNTLLTQFTAKFQIECLLYL